MLLICGGGSIIAIAVGFVVPLINNVRQGNYMIYLLLAVLIAIAASLIYILKRKGYKKQLNQQKKLHVIGRPGCVTKFELLILWEVTKNA